MNILINLIALIRRYFKFQPQKENNAIWRIDGAWFTCFDGKIAPSQAQFNVLSFGINNDFKLDQQMNQIYECEVHSFDPFVEGEFFSDLRSKSKALEKSPTSPLVKPDVTSRREMVFLSYRS